MQLSQAGLDLIRKFEGLRLTPYQDVAGFWTIGYGHLMTHDEVKEPITEQDATNLLLRDAAWAEQAVNTLVTVPLTQNQFDALVDFTYNLGMRTLKKSTLLTVLNQKNYIAIPHYILQYTDADGKIVKGLVERRGAEALLFGAK